MAKWRINGKPAAEKRITGTIIKMARKKRNGHITRYTDCIGVIINGRVLIHSAYSGWVHFLATKGIKAETVNLTDIHVAAGLI